MADAPTPTSSTPTSPAPATSASASAAPEETPKRRLPTALVYDPAFLDHLVPRGFPERPARLAQAMAVIEALIAEGTLPAEKLLRLAPRPATRAELTTVHHDAYVERVRQTVELLMEGVGYEARPRAFDSEVFLSPGSYNAAVLAAGASLVALDAIGERRARNGYALVRPPGHHALPDLGMGFCIFNNVAVAARYAQQRWGWQRVLIVDYDVHHGNGTQEMFYDDPDVVYFSTHQAVDADGMLFYPSTGQSTDVGTGKGAGTTINVPLPPECGWSVFDPIFRQVLWPVADRLKPDVILLSAGFDAHWRDPMADERLCTADYSDLTREVIEIADRYCDGRIVAVQEGGYDLDVMGQCAATVLFALTGSDAVVDNLGEPPPLESRWNEEAIIQALYQLHDLAGYRRKPRRPQVREGWTAPKTTPSGE
ncbi:MAG TPA: histone deacetylase [Ktedonobacterales bacterium]|nr:histone deacetylase [Ktedonobacterales bacterium]